MRFKLVEDILDKNAIAGEVDAFISRNAQWESSMGGIRRFTSLPYSTFRRILDTGIPVDSRTLRLQRRVEDYALQDWLNLDGYVVDASRPDFRISIDGLSSKGGKEFPPYMISIIKREFVDASTMELSKNSVIMWYD